MNLLKGFKEKMSVVSEDISNSILSKAKAKKSSSLGVDLQSVGAAELLKCYQSYWADIHRESFNIGRAASLVDNNMEKIFADSSRKYDNFVQLHNEIANIDQLSVDLDKAINLIAELTLSCSVLESSMTVLEDAVEAGEMKRREQERSTQLMLQKRQAGQTLQLRKVDMAREHASKIARLEMEKQHTLLERQATFDEEFQRDLEFYRLHGHPEKVRSDSKTSEEDRLAAMNLEEDPDALDFFLSQTNDDVTVTSPVSETPSSPISESDDVAAGDEENT